MGSATLYSRDGTAATVSDTDWDGGGHNDQVTLFGTTADRFTAWLQATAVNASAAFIANSTDSVIIGTGPKSFTVEENKPFYASSGERDGSWVRIEEDGAPVNYMEGRCTAYDPDTGALTVDVQRTSGSGTISDWKLFSLGSEAPLARPGVTFAYAFDTTTSEADPGTGNLRANSSDLTAATKLFVDDESAEGQTAVDALLTLGNSTSVSTKGQLQIVARYDPTRWVIYDITGLTDEAGYVDVDVSHVASSGTSPFTDGAEIVIAFVRAGDKGDDGDLKNSDGSSTDNGLARFDGTGGGSVQDTSGPTLLDDGRIANVTDPTDVQDAMTLGAARLKKEADVDLSGQSSVDITGLPTDKRALVFQFVNCKNDGSGNVDLEMQISDDNGSTFITATNYSSEVLTLGGTNTLSNGDDRFKLSLEDSVNNSGRNFHGAYWMYDNADADSINLVLRCPIYGSNFTSAPRGSFLYNALTSAPVDAVRVSLSADNFASGSELIVWSMS